LAENARIVATADDDDDDDDLPRRRAEALRDAMDRSMIHSFFIL
jgi:hypothetical protein